jgi:predicted cytidylate kinase
MLITLSGEPGSGKTTVARLVARKLGLPHVYAGDLFRREAEARGLSLQEFNALCESDHSIDRALDDRMLVAARQGNVVLEGRLAGFFAQRHGLEALKVWLTASDAVRAERVARRENDDARRVLEMNRIRQASDARRYREIYGFDLADTSIYDVLLCSDDQTPEALAEQLVAEAHRRFDGTGRGP